jgi:hypothetical protein
VAYRIVGHSFVLQDIEARVMVDFIPGPSEAALDLKWILAV